MPKALTNGGPFTRQSRLGQSAGQESTAPSNTNSLNYLSKSLGLRLIPLIYAAISTHINFERCLSLKR
jgi:hypothetical protein